jgi:hypothetical protein
MSNIDETYSKHRYEINIVECAYEVVQRMKAVKKRGENGHVDQPKTEYTDQLFSFA